MRIDATLQRDYPQPERMKARPASKSFMFPFMFAAVTVVLSPLSISAQHALTEDMQTGVSATLATKRALQLRMVHYNLALDVTNSDFATGTVNISFQKRGNDDVIIDFRGTSITRIVANGKVLDPKRKEVWNGAHARIPANILHDGENALTLAFTSPIAPAGASIIRTHDVTDGADYLYTLLVPSDANLLFPCFDQPDIKARVTLELTTVGGWKALGNGKLLGIDTVSTSSASSAYVFKFAPTEPISTYLIAFAAGPWKTVSRKHVISPGTEPASIDLWVRASRVNEAESDTLIAMNARALNWLGRWFDIPFPFGKFDALLAPAFPFGGMEHPGAVFYNEESFIFRERPTVSQLLGRQATIFHEVAHQWFGDYMTMRWFDDLWLKEGFATFMAARMQASLDPSSNAWKTFYLRNKPVAYATDATAGTTPIWQSLLNLDQAKSNYGPIVYNKAPGVLRQLEFSVGEDAFQKGVSQFLKTHAYGNAGWRDLLKSVGDAAGRDLTSWGSAWILRPGMPVVEQLLEVSGGRISSLTLAQRPAQPGLSHTGAWPLSLQLLLYYADREPVRITVTMNSDSLTIPQATGLPAPAFVFANEGDYGYALVLPDSASVGWLEMHVTDVKDDFLRAMLWGSLWDLVREARLSPSRYAALVLRELPKETDEQIASGLVGRLGVALTRYASESQRDSLLPTAERVLGVGASNPALPYGMRKAQLDGMIALASSQASIAQIDSWLDADSALGIALRPPTRWAIVIHLVSEDAPTASGRLRQQSLRDSTTEGRRQAFVAGAAAPRAEVKREYFTRWFSDTTLNEEWVTSSLRAFHDQDQDALTRSYLVPALDSLRWIQANRRIFFLGSWLSATIGGQRDAESLVALDAWLSAHPALPSDLRQKVLQSRDELERTVMIRRVFARQVQQPQLH